MRFVHRRQNQVLEHFDVVRIDDGPVDFDLAQAAAAVSGDLHHTAPTRARDRSVSQLGLQLRKTGLNLLAQLEKLLKIGHSKSKLALSFLPSKLPGVRGVLHHRLAASPYH